MRRAQRPPETRQARRGRGRHPQSWEQPRGQKEIRVLASQSWGVLGKSRHKRVREGGRGTCSQCPQLGATPGRTLLLGLAHSILTAALQGDDVSSCIAKAEEMCPRAQGEGPAPDSRRRQSRRLCACAAPLAPPIPRRVCIFKRTGEVLGPRQHLASCLRSPSLPASCR